MEIPYRVMVNVLFRTSPGKLEFIAAFSTYERAVAAIPPNAARHDYSIHEIALDPT